MCGRYWLDEDPELRPIVEEMNRSQLVEKFHRTSGITTKGEVRPAAVVPVIASDKSGGKRVFPMQWGFNRQPLLINARVETASSKPTFKEAWTSHRCIVPASYYFEWEHFTDNSGRKRTGPKYLLQPRDQTMTWLCGLYRIEDGLPHFVILTRNPSEDIRFIHDRMPLMMPEEAISDWIRPTTKPEEMLGESLDNIYFEKVEDQRDGQMRLF